MSDSVMDNRFLVTGALRSGTTFTGKCIDFSPRVFYLWEPFMSKFRREVKDFFPYVSKSSTKKKTAYYKKVIEDTIRLKNITPRKLYEPNPFLDFTITRPNGMIRSALRYRFAQLRYFIQKYFKDSLLIKDSTAVFLSETLINDFDFKIVVTIRHPAAVYYSRKKLDWRFYLEWWDQKDLYEDYLQSVLDDIGSSNENDLIGSSILWNTIYSYVHDLKQDYGDSVLVVRHEDLCFSPVEHFQKIYDFLNLPFGSSEQKKIRAYTSGKATEASTDDKGMLTKRNAEEVATKWQKELPEDEIERVYRYSNALLDHYYPEEYLNVHM